VSARKHTCVLFQLRADGNETHTPVDLTIRCIAADFIAPHLRVADGIWSWPQRRRGRRGSKGAKLEAKRGHGGWGRNEVRAFVAPRHPGASVAIIDRVRDWRGVRRAASEIVSNRCAGRGRVTLRFSTRMAFLGLPQGVRACIALCVAEGEDGCSARLARG
jgi:hypothetical protein